jgi:hypothetical protein
MRASFSTPMGIALNSLFRSAFPNNRSRGSVNGFYVRAAGAEEIVRRRRLIGRFWAPPRLHR